MGDWTFDPTSRAFGACRMIAGAIHCLLTINITGHACAIQDYHISRNILHPREF